MGARVRGPVAVTVVLLTLAAVFAGGSDGLRPLAGLHLSLRHERPASATEQPSHRATDSRASRQDSGSADRPASPVHGPGAAFRWLFLLVLALCCVAAAVASLRIRITRRRQRHAIRPSPLGGTVEGPDVEPEDLGEALQAGLAGLDEGGSVRNAVVAAWVRLEEHAAKVGVARHPEDTPAEFVTRALAAELDPDALAELADLYREARFSRHPIGEAHREAARDCLVRLTRRRTAVTG